MINLHNMNWFNVKQYTEYIHISTVNVHELLIILLISNIRKFWALTSVWSSQLLESLRLNWLDLTIRIKQVWRKAQLTIIIIIIIIRQTQAFITDNHNIPQDWGKSRKSPRGLWYKSPILDWSRNTRGRTSMTWWWCWSQIHMKKIMTVMKLVRKAFLTRAPVNHFTHILMARAHTHTHTLLRNSLEFVVQQILSDFLLKHALQ